VTTIDAAAARHVHKRLALAALAVFLGGGLGGCETSNNIFGDAAPAEPQAAALQQPVAPAAPAVPAQVRVAIAPVIGAPETVARQFLTQLSDAVEKQKIAVAKAPTDKADYTLRGYVVAAREKAGTKVSYIWDVTDPTGKRVNRITGEELAGAAEARDPWTAVTPQIVQTIAGKTAASLGAWLPQQPHAAMASSPPATDIAAQPVVQSVSLAAAPAATTTTGSIGREAAVAAFVPSVSGAPGDGAVSLTSALQQELSRNGIALAGKAAPASYRVQGKVTMGQGKDGKQPIQIDWHVKDPNGKLLGTVTQKNEVPQGSLDSNWGATADLAAAAAAQGVLQLLRQPSSTN
jgi:hypothetical protein